MANEGLTITKYHARDEADLDCIEGKPDLDRSMERCEVSQAPIMTSLPELGTIPSPRAVEKKLQRSQTGRLKAAGWRRLPIGKMLVTSFLVVLTGATYWGLSGGNGSSILPGVQETTVHQLDDGEKEFLDSLEMTSFPEFSMQDERAVMTRPPVIMEQVTPTRVTLGQVIVQPEPPVLTARRPAKSGEELPGGELRREVRTAR